MCPPCKSRLLWSGQLSLQSCRKVEPQFLTSRRRPRHQLLVVHPLCCRAQVEVRDTIVGDTKDHTQHSIVGGPPDAPPLVCLPGYGAGSGFYFRNLRDMCRHFRTYLTDPLGTGMSGVAVFSPAVHRLMMFPWRSPADVPNRVPGQWHARWERAAAHPGLFLASRSLARTYLTVLLGNPGQCGMSGAVMPTCMHALEMAAMREFKGASSCNCVHIAVPCSACGGTWCSAYEQQVLPA